MPTGIGGEVAWWCPSLDTIGNGTTLLNDLTGNGNNGTLTNMDPATDWVADTSNGGVRALDFDGVNDRIDFGQSVLISGGAFSVSWWERIPSPGASSFYSQLAFRTSASSAFIIYRSNSANYTFLSWRDTTSSASTALRASNASSPSSVANQWRHFVIVGQDIKSGTAASYAVYENGSLLTIVSAGIFAAATFVNNIGSDGLGTFSATQIDDMRVIRRAISASEAAALASRRGYNLPSNTRRRRYAGAYGL